MIYDEVDSNEPLRQGDIFHNLPSLRFSLNEIALYTAEETLDHESITWEQMIGISAESQPILLACKPVDAIVVTQSCDAARRTYITLAEIAPTTLPTNVKKRVETINDYMRAKLGYFYLPEETSLRMSTQVADFNALFSLPREELLSRRTNLRRLTLKPIAREHLREALAHFFRRYAFDEWYALNRGEFAAYHEKRGYDSTIKPFDHQKPTES